ncbi:hypothetical protein Tco_1237041 [Tanacetum coccineum]
MPRGTTQVVTRGASNDCVSDCAGGRWRLDQSDGDTWHWRVSVRGTVAVSPRPSAITPDLPIPNSLIMEDEHLDTIPVTESANTIKSSVEELVPTPSESADLSDDERECDVPVNDESSLTFATFSNPLFDSKDDFTFVTTRSLLMRDFDYLLEEFSGELAHTDPIPPGRWELLKPNRKLRRNSYCLREFCRIDIASPRPPEIDLFLASDDSMPPGIEIDDYDSEGDIRFLEELLSSDSLPFPKMSLSLDHFDDPSLPRPPPEPRMLTFALILSLMRVIS